MEDAQKGSKAADTRKIASFTLGLLGIVDSVAIAFFLTSTLSAIVSSSGQTLESYMIIGTTSIIVAALIFGGYMIIAENPKKGAKMNLAAGCLQTSIYVYYSLFYQPSLLSWINPPGIILLLPSLLSGLIAQSQPQKP
jgi:threonine/homoserine/homoserine lactone efflux protein